MIRSYDFNKVFKFIATIIRPIARLNKTNDLTRTQSRLDFGETGNGLARFIGETDRFACPLDKKGFDLIGQIWCNLHLVFQRPLEKPLAHGLCDHRMTGRHPGTTTGQIMFQISHHRSIRSPHKTHQPIRRMGFTRDNATALGAVVLIIAMDPFCVQNKVGLEGSVVLMGLERGNSL